MSKTKKQLASPSKKIPEDIKKLVMARILASSGDLGVSIGSKGYTKKEMLKSVERGDEIGQEIVNIHMEYLRDMAKGAIYQQSNDTGSSPH